MTVDLQSGSSGRKDVLRCSRTASVSSSSTTLKVTPRLNHSASVSRSELIVRHSDSGKNGVEGGGQYATVIHHFLFAAVLSFRECALCTLWTVDAAQCASSVCCALGECCLRFTEDINTNLLASDGSQLRYFYLARPLSQAQSGYWCVCWCVCRCVCPHPRTDSTFRYLLDL